MDQRLINELLPVPSTGALSAVLNFPWDGRDLDGHMVPNGAFGITIRASNYKGDQADFDSFEGHSNRYFSIEAKYDRHSEQIRYSLPGPAQVSIRAGVGQGPLLNNILGWRPRPAGANVESWDGKDASGTVDALALERGYLLAEAIALPERIILTEGNDQYSHATYTKTYTFDRPLKEVASDTAIKGAQNEILYDEIPTGGDRIDVHLKLSGPGAMTAGNEPVINGKTAVKVFLSEHSKQLFAGDRYEIICFVDYSFVTEFEEGYSPTTWILDAGTLSDGAHVLTVNVATLSGQMGSASMKVFVKNSQAREKKGDDTHEIGIYETDKAATADISFHWFLDADGFVGRCRTGMRRRCCRLHFGGSNIFADHS